MPNFLTRLGGTDPLTLAQRQADEQMALARAQGSAMAARDIARVEALRDVTEEALLSAAEVATFAKVLSSRTPYAEEELTFIARTGIAAMGNVVMRTGRRCGS